MDRWQADIYKYVYIQVAPMFLNLIWQNYKGCFVTNTSYLIYFVPVAERRLVERRVWVRGEDRLSYPLSILALRLVNIRWSKLDRGWLHMLNGRLPLHGTCLIDNYGKQDTFCGMHSLNCVLGFPVKVPKITFWLHALLAVEMETDKKNIKNGSHYITISKERWTKTPLS